MTWDAVEALEPLSIDRKAEIARGPEATRQPLRIVVRPSLGLGLSLGLSAGMFGALAAAVIIDSTIKYGFGGMRWLALLLGVPVAVLAAGWGFVGSSQLLLEWFLPEALGASDNCLRVRTRAGVARRTDVSVPIEAVAGIGLRLWQGGLREVWIAHRAGAAFRVFGPQDLAKAQRVSAQLTTRLPGGK